MTDAAHCRLINMRRHGSRLRKVLAKRAMMAPVTPKVALNWANNAASVIKASPAWKRFAGRKS